VLVLPCGLLDTPMALAERDGHPVEGVGEIAEFVATGDVEPRLQVATGDAPCAVPKRKHRSRQRPSHRQPRNENHRDQREEHQQRVAQRPLEIGFHRDRRDVDAEHRNPLSVRRADRRVAGEPGAPAVRVEVGFHQGRVQRGEAGRQQRARVVVDDARRRNLIHVLLGIHQKAYRTVAVAAQGVDVLDVGRVVADALQQTAHLQIRRVIHGDVRRHLGQQIGIESRRADGDDIAESLA
jgi:hypothetical protein